MVTGRASADSFAPASGLGSITWTLTRSWVSFSRQTTRWSVLSPSSRGFAILVNIKRDRFVLMFGGLLFPGYALPGVIEVPARSFLPGPGGWFRSEERRVGKERR